MELPDLSSSSRGGCLPHRGGRDRPAILVQAMDGGLSMGERMTFIDVALKEGE